LERWAGKALVRRATQALAAGLNAEVTPGAAIVIRFPTRGITCRWMPGAGLAGMICSCQKPERCEHRVAAVLAWQMAHAGRTIAAGVGVLAAAEEPPRTRDEVRASAQSVLCEMVGIGLARLSTATHQRLETLAVSCHGVNLPRLEHWLASLAHATRLLLRRDAQADTDDVLQRAARVAALVAALAKPTARLVGQHRSRYEPVKELTLAGFGARRWSSPSGFVGLTVYFWDDALGAWSSWNDVRPRGTPGFDPLRRYRDYGPWQGCPSPAVASRSRWQLAGAARNADGRVSGRAGTRAMLVGDTDPRSAPGAVGDWSSLVERARRLFGGGLGERGEHDDLVVLRPAVWLPARYDEVRQELVRPVLDNAQRLLPLVVPFAPETASAVEVLERHEAG
ncbi:MAG: hypothetical protein ACREJM_11790, partial [Candidatus Saccharimonadales bacterium]